jgi:NAD(P)H-hydrate repair Nnr-like enzyme with NAD(P)H-hydrate dehydratase domain
VLVVGGARELPGAVLLAGVGALRAGAGKLQLAVPRGIAPALGVALPEALVAGLAETREAASRPPPPTRSRSAPSARTPCWWGPE